MPIPKDYQKSIEQNIKKDLKEKSYNLEERTNILPKSKLDDWIKKIATIDLENCEKEIKQK